MDFRTLWLIRLFMSLQSSSATMATVAPLDIFARVALQVYERIYFYLLSVSFKYFQSTIFRSKIIS